MIMNTNYDKYWEQHQANNQTVNNQTVNNQTVNNQTVNNQTVNNQMTNMKFDYLGLVALILSTLNGGFATIFSMWLIFASTFSSSRPYDDGRIVMWLSTGLMFILWVIVMVSLFTGKRRAMGLSVAAAIVIFLDLIFHMLVLVVIR